MEQQPDTRKLTTPVAITMLVLAGLHILFVAGSMLFSSSDMMRELEDVIRESDPTFDMPDALMSSAGFVSNLVSIAIGLFVGFGALKLLKQEAWGLSLAAAILMVIPCLGPCCPIGIPVGIWAIVILVRNDVRVSMGQLPPETPSGGAPPAFTVPPAPGPTGPGQTGPGQTSPDRADSGGPQSSPPKEDDGGWGSSS